MGDGRWKRPALKTFDVARISKLVYCLLCWSRKRINEGRNKDLFEVMKRFLAFRGNVRGGLLPRHSNCSGGGGGAYTSRVLKAATTRRLLMIPPPFSTLRS